MKRWISTGITCFLLMAVSSVANAQALQIRIAFPFEIYDPCNDEIVVGEVVSHPVLLPDAKQNLSSKGVGVGLTTGTVYESTGVGTIETEVIEDGDVITFLTTGIFRFRLLSHGDSPNLVVTTKLEHGVVVMIDPATGFPIVIDEFDNTSEVIDCRGSDQ